MFQYSAAKSLLKKDENVYLDHYFLEENRLDTENFTARNYELGIFKNIKARRVKLWQTALFKKGKLLPPFIKSFFKCIKQQGIEYIPLTNGPGEKHLYLDGYFQSEYYFKNQRQDLLNDFQFPSLDTVNSELKNKIEAATNSVSVHIRRGDYLKSKTVLEIHGILPFSYYLEALNILKDKYQPLTLFIFSDDIPWVKTNFKNIDIESYFIDNNTKDSWKDMALMSYCKHHIIANSSFSWWGAWLNRNPDKIIIAPKIWFADPELNLKSKSIIPETWTRI